MKAWSISAICILLTVLCLFSAVGYAALSDTLQILGEASVEIPYGLFITNVETVNQSANIETNEVSFLPYTTTVKSAIKRSSKSTGTVTYRITVKNNTRLTYSYRDIYYQTGLKDYNGNDFVSGSNNKSKIGVVCELKSASVQNKKVLPGESKEFTVTYTIGSEQSEKETWSTLINFQFGINVDGEREALAVVEEKFLNILNTPATYNQLVDDLDNKFDGYQEWTSNYIGNVKGSSSEDSVAVNTLFAGQLQITVGRDNLDATVLIKHENLDWNYYTGDDYTAKNESNGGELSFRGCEMTLYLTIDPLNKADTYVPVYAVVFTCDRDYDGNKTSDWYRIGSTYAGTANVVTYDGQYGTGSFVTDNWIADANTYQIIDGYSYNIKGESFKLNAYSHSVESGTKIQTIVRATDAAAVTTFRTLLDDARRIIQDQAYAGVGIDLVEEAYTRYAGLYTVNWDGSHTVSSELTIAQLSPAIVNLYEAVNDALSEMDKLSKQ